MCKLLIGSIKIWLRADKNDEDEKIIEKLLTKTEKSGIIQKLSDTRASGYRASKKILKKVLNVLDKIEKM